MFLSRLPLRLLVTAYLSQSLHWTMRPRMQQVPALLKGKAPEAWCLYMTGTLSKEDTAKARQQFCMSEDLLIISANPVLPNHFFLNIQRPSSINGFDGIQSLNGDTEEGLGALISHLLEPWKNNIKEGSSPKVTMLFCKVIITAVISYQGLINIISHK